MYRAETLFPWTNFLSLCKATLHQIQKLLGQKRNHSHTGSTYKFFYGVALEKNTGPEFTKIKRNTDGADLVLCGHTHRGQMFPVTLFTQWAYGAKRFWGQHQFGQTHAIVSAGCGVFQLPIRLGTDNEVVSIDLVY